MPTFSAITRTGADLSSPASSLSQLSSTSTQGYSEALSEFYKQYFKVQPILVETVQRITEKGNVKMIDDTQIQLLFITIWFLIEPLSYK